MNHELKKAIETICKDRGLDKDMLIDTLEEAVRISVQRRFNDDVEVEVTYKEDTGDIEVFQFKVVVADDDLDNPDTEITLADALKLDPNVQLDDEMGFRVKVEDLGRIAAQSAKQVIIQRMRDAEQEFIYEEYKDRVGEIVSGIVQRRDKGGWVINLGRTEAILPREEHIPREHFKRGDRVQAIIIEVRKEGRGPQVVISRTHKNYMIALFKREVPEVDDGVVQIMEVARDPGSRAKVAVLSRDREVDPVGACVGVRGSRIQNIVQELHGERIDIVVWSQDIAIYARNALAPALVVRVVVDDEENLLEVIVPDDQLTNAIGRKGQNVKLAATLLGWKVDIFTETRYNAANAIGHGLEQAASVMEVPLESLLDAGYTSLASLSDASDAELTQKLALTESRIADLRAAIKFLSSAGDASQAEETEEDATEAADAQTEGGDAATGGGDAPSEAADATTEAAGAPTEDGGAAASAQDDGGTSAGGEDAPTAGGDAAAPDDGKDASSEDEKASASGEDGAAEKGATDGASASDAQGVPAAGNDPDGKANPGQEDVRE